VTRRRSHDPFLGEFGTTKIGRDATFVKDQHPIGHSEELGQLTRDEDDGEALHGQLLDEPVHRSLRPAFAFVRRLL